MIDKSENRIVLMTHADYLPTLEAARELGKIGVKVIVSDPKKYRISNWSKYVKYVKAPDVKDTEKFIDWLKENSKQGLFNAFLPTSDLTVWYAASRYKELSKHMDIFVPSQKSLDACLFKDLTYKHCLKHKIGTPLTYFPLSIKDVKKISRKISYPALIKHRTSIGMGISKKGEVVYSAEELIKKYKKDLLVYDRKEIIKRSPNVEWSMIQEYIPKAVDNLYSPQGISADNGRRISIMPVKRIRAEPPKLGIGVCTEAVKNIEPANEIKKFMRAIKFEGPFGSEVLFDERDSKYKIIDINPRLTGLTGAAVANGMNLPLLWYNVLDGNKNVEDRVFTGNKIYIHLTSDLLYMPGNILHATSKMKAIKNIFRTYISPKKFSVLSLDDPVPFLIDVAVSLRWVIKHPLSYMRRLIKGE